MNIKSITLENGKEIPLWEECKNSVCCHGNVLKDVKENEISAEWENCPVCNGFGQTPIYYTSEKYLMEGGVMTNDTAVWYKWGIEWKLAEWWMVERQPDVDCVMGFCKKPTFDWRPE